MNIKEIDEITFDEFAKKHILKNFFQTKEYGRLMKHSDFSVMYIGGYQDNVLVAASLILHKTIGPNIKYGYAPRGFLVDYQNQSLLDAFTKKVKDFFFKKGFAFIKINPEITFATLDFDNKSKTINTKNKELVAHMKMTGYDKLKDNLYFESLLPKYTPVIHLPSYDVNILDKSFLDTMREHEMSGIRLINGNINDIELFYNFIDEKETKTLTYYKYFYEKFHESDMVDLLLCEIDYPTYIKYLQKEHINEEDKNEYINNLFNENPNNTDLYNQKLKSDQTLNKIAASLSFANERMDDSAIKEIIGAAFVVKNQGRVTIITTGHNKNFFHIDTKSYMYFKIIEEYKKAGYNYVDLYGITADFTENNPYKELNNFKLKFKPNVYEYIGEFDLIVNKPFHQILWSTNQLQKEFYRPAIKK